MLLGLVWNFVLAFAWFFLSGNFSMGSFVVGLIFGYLCLILAQNQIKSIRDYPTRSLGVLSFVVFFFSELIKSNIAVGKAALNPRLGIVPGVIAVPLQSRSNAVLVIMSNFITLTPGTISMDISDDKSTLYIHALDLSDPEGVAEGVKDLERRVMRLMGHEPGQVPDADVPGEDRNA